MSLTLKDFQPFNLLPDQVVQELELETKTYPKDSMVFTEGQSSLGCLFIVASGLAEIIKGNSGVVGLRHPGEFFGETVILTGKRYPASVKVRQELTCHLLRKEKFEMLLQNHKEFAGYFSQILTDRLRTLYEEMVLDQPSENFGFNSEPFKQRVLDIMSAPIVTCPPDYSISQIARIFSQKKISSVVITGPNGKMLGLVSERDLITKVLGLDSNPAVVTAQDIMDKNPATLPLDAIFYQALVTMLKRQGKYIVIMDRSKPVGMVTIGDLTRARSTSSLAVVKEIDSANSQEELANAAKLMYKIVSTMLNEKAAASEITGVISELGDSITRRLLVLAEEELVKRGLGLPPVDYCWITMGSGGRRELTLSSDQDNGIIYEEPPVGKEREIREYFLTLAEYVTQGLEKCGFFKCPGDIMATNGSWCQSLKDWKKAVHDWTYTPTPEASRQFTIFLDFRPVYGQDYLARELRAYTIRLFRIAPAILHNMAIDDLQHRVPLTVFKNVILEKGKEHRHQVDMKKAACVHIIDCVRIFAMREGITETNTLGRLNKLVELEVLASDDAEYYEAAMKSLTMFRIREHLRKLRLGIIPDNYVDPDNLSKRQKAVLRESFIAIDHLQNFTGFAFQIENRL